MKTRDGYALDLLSPVRHVATEMDRVGSDGPAPSIAAMTATYQHTITGDLARIRQHEGAPNDYEARLWLISRAVEELGRQVTSDGNGGFRLAKPFSELKYQGRKVRPAVRAGEESEKETLRATYHNLEKELRPFRVTVATNRSTREADLTLHPLAHAIPRMSEKEFDELAADVKANGVKLPITVMGSKVIDGRHRLAVASALKVPVRTVEFAGSEDEARRHIVSLNLIRRNLTMAQRVLIVRQVLLPEAEAEAKERQLANLNVNSESAPSGANSKASQIAAERSAGLATARSIERAKDLDTAPQTQERIRSGEIKTVAEAARAAAEELGKEPDELPALKPRSAYDYLGQALHNVRAATNRIEQGDRGNITEESFTERIDQIKRALHDLRALVTGGVS
jgi:ParB/Sulfiredoxin domain